MAHLNSLGLENFRVFKEKQVFDFAPITILTGTNSSGKSSLINALKLISENFKCKEIDESDEFTVESLFEVEFDVKKLIDRYGGLQQFITKGSANNSFTFTFNAPMYKSDDAIEISYTIQLENNILKTGRLVEVNMYSLNEDKVIFKILRLEQKIKARVERDYKEKENDNKFGVKRGESEDFYYSTKIDLEYFYQEFTKCISQSAQVFEALDEIKEQIQNVYNKDDEMLKPIWAKIAEINNKFDLDYEIHTGEKGIYLWSHREVLGGGDSRIVYQDQDKFKPLYEHFKQNKGIYDFSYLWVDDKKYQAEFDELMEANYGRGLSNIDELLTQDIILFLSDFNWKESNARIKNFVYEPIVYLKPLKSPIQLKSNHTSSFSLLSFINQYVLSELGNYPMWLFGRDKKWDTIKDHIVKRLSTFQLSSIEKNETFHRLIEPLVLLILKSGFETNDGSLSKNDDALSTLESYFYSDFLYSSVKKIKSLFAAFENLTFIDVNRTSMKRTQTISDDNVLSALVNNLFKLPQKSYIGCLEFINRWVLELDIASRVEFKKDDESSNYKIHFFDETGKKILLSDYGYGTSQLLPIIINLCPPEIYFNSEPLDDVAEKYYKRTIVIEEPENSLHPALQSKLADMFVEAAKLFNTQVIIETHSEYLIRKLQYLTAKADTNLNPKDTVIYYFNHPDKVQVGENQVKRIKIEKDGSLTGHFGKGFFDEADNIALEIFLLNNSQKN